MLLRRGDLASSPDSAQRAISQALLFKPPALQARHSHLAVDWGVLCREGGLIDMRRICRYLHAQLRASGFVGCPSSQANDSRYGSHHVLPGAPNSRVSKESWCHADSAAAAAVLNEDCRFQPAV
eukprot:6190817-Pleurochrysis_carterae.AAC.4